MNITLDFKQVEDAEDCNMILNAFGHTTEPRGGQRVVVPWVDGDYETLKSIVGEAAVFAPVQITIE